jgi:hypothetical protein
MDSKPDKGPKPQTYQQAWLMIPCKNISTQSVLKTVVKFLKYWPRNGVKLAETTSH